MRRGPALAIAVLILAAGAWAVAAGPASGRLAANDIAAAAAGAPDRGEHLVDTAPGVISPLARLDDRHSRFLKPAVVVGSFVFLAGAWAIAWVLRSEPTVALHHLCSRRPASRAPPRSLS